MRDRAASRVIPRPLLSTTPGRYNATLSVGWEEVATENAVVEDKKGASLRPMLKMINVGRLR